VNDAPPRGHLPAFDGLRGLAILVVVLHNSTGIEARDTLLEKLWLFVVDAGWIGVQLFFVLSGFLITGILLDSRGKPRGLRTFYARRSLRIFPLYYVFLIGRFAVAPIFVASAAVPLATQLWYWLYVSNWGDLVGTPLTGLTHFWSLAVEEQFYLLWPALAMRLSLRTFAWVCGALAAVALAARIGMRVADVKDTWMYASTLTRMDGLALGALVAIALRTERGRALYARARAPALIAAGLGLAAVMAYAHGLNRHEWVVQSIGYSMLAVLFALLVAEVATPAPWGWRAGLAHPALRFVGRYSYAMYVVHLPVKFLIRDHLLGAWFGELTAAHPLIADLGFTWTIVVVSLGLALLSYAAIERPFLALKDRWAPA
jgi:peptidoglycan/LPS O-acetylase OafA/YrhL